ncbi:Fumarylacetoacetase, protein [Cordyceps fumosorosea ARSEF 2679]|uniref:Fumarylacetoacetase, protein n=1 Tax=Cordyceps fumosorosea (strain ARSEF 2679) TaxID=1081104 RepID=A0A168D9M5_CORFA|nr:Fumarylacetoacetase, protein [Cordyceps fumosorosea ARSEF 2679]OAA72330.1 Fumarylacetoacetase, protein [Cordyceps fumosorosea ARSEF 2679]
MEHTFHRLVRFEDGNGTTLYGDVTDPSVLSDLVGATVAVLDGDLDTGFVKTTRKAIINKVLCPLERVPYFVCIGLNYKKHAEEANLAIAENPVIFAKPPDALAGPSSSIPIPLLAQPRLDYEGELGVVIGRDARDVPAASALSFVLGYVNANDLSARHLQMPAAVSGGQFCFAKSFDGFAPLGPVVASPAAVPDPQALGLVTRVNGETRQESSTADMIWGVRELVAFASQGTTLRRGTVILTGTPSGVGLFMEPQRFLEDGDVVEVSFDGLGTLRNTMQFQK